MDMESADIPINGTLCRLHARTAFGHTLPTSISINDDLIENGE